MLRTLRFAGLIVALWLGVPVNGAAQSAAALERGKRVPAFTYRLLDGHSLKPNALRGHRYVLWLVASWCSSCQAGSQIVADHLAVLRTHGVRVVELRLAHDLGAPGPGLAAFRKVIGSAANDPLWFWGEASDAQTLALDPKGFADIYYLVDERGTIVEVNGNPAVSWDRIGQFATSGR